MLRVLLDAHPAHARSLVVAEALGWPEIKRLMTVPGVNVIVAATFMAAVGDIRRFDDRRKLTAYLPWSAWRSEPMAVA